MVSSDRPVSLEDEVSHSMKEMIGGCCVCSDERGWAENPLVYCDGHGCSVAVHQACYGIVQVPTGPWFCRKCESQERAARVMICSSSWLAFSGNVPPGYIEHHCACPSPLPRCLVSNVPPVSGALMHCFWICLTAAALFGPKSFTTCHMSFQVSRDSLFYIYGFMPFISVVIWRFKKERW
uniref:MLLT10 histone lysine methyltransferase DOT1L cofactor n=1 Tax=Cercocebus atys TaxID=9531 RepID=A0A2K5MBG2_CERAT